jgi:hypothetical protein
VPDDRKRILVSVRRRLIGPLLGLLVTLLAWASFQAPAVATNDDSGSTAPAQERIAVGDEAPDFALETLEGRNLRLSDLRGEKNAVIILFRGAW